MQVSIKSSLEKLAFNQDSNIHFIVSLTAPKLNTNSRPPILVFPVLDISGSMAGDKLNYAKQSIIKLIDHLKPGDFIGLATFESNVELIQAPVEITQDKKNELKAKVNKISSRGMTAFSAGMTLALEEINKLNLSDVNCRVIMFTDGQANIGPKGKEIITVLDQHMKKCSVSAFGYGVDADADLLAELSTCGGGNYAFIGSPDEAPKAFAKELGGLLSSYAHDIEVKFSSSELLKNVELVTDLTMKENVVKIPELLSEEVRHLVYIGTVHQLSQAKELLESVKYELANLSVKFRTVDGAAEMNSALKVEFVEPAQADSKVDPSLDHILALAQLARAQINAENKAKQGDYVGAVQVMNCVAQDFSVRGLDSFTQTSQKIGQKMSSAAEYTNSSAYLNSSKMGMTRGYGVTCSHNEAFKDIAELGVVYTNSAQEEVMDAFTKPTDEKKLDDPE